MYDAEDLLIGREGETTSHSHPDMKMEVDISVYDPQTITIFHDRPFTQELSWVEYDTINHSIEFVMDDGKLRNFGIPVDEKVGEYLKHNQEISVVLREDKTALTEIIVPLINHTA